MSRYGCSESTASDSVRPGQSAVSSSHGATTTCWSAGASRRASSRIASIGTSRPAAAGDGRRDRDLRLRVLKTLRHRRGREAREHRHLHRADVRAGVRGDGDLGRHRQVDRDAVAGLDAEPEQRLGELDHLVRELGERERAARAVLTEPDRRLGAGERSGRPAMDAVPGDVELPAREPGRPFGAAREVDDLLPRLEELEAHVLDRSRPEPLALVDRAPHELAVVGDAVAAHQPDDVRALEHLVVRRPHDLRHRRKGSPCRATPVANLVRTNK